MDANSDLLFGVLAVQLGFASPQQVMACAAAWSTDRRRTLPERLEDEGTISTEKRCLIEKVVAESITAHEGDARKTLANLGGEQAVYRSFGGSIQELVIADRELLPEEGRSNRFEGDTNVTFKHPGRYTFRNVQDIEIEKGTDSSEISRGAFGKILIAMDKHLGREVALKELLPEHASGSSPSSPTGRSSSHLARFLREARVTAQLEHPNIVPIYELGRRADGTLYYSMKYIRGKTTLAKALGECETLQDRLKLLNHFIDICQAIGYAHSRGVIHRDIKPENVMVGEFGETLVIDWGLAKVKDQEDIRNRDIEKGMKLIKDAAAGKTVDGQAIGTAFYMSPEQAEGKIDQIDEQSDIWGLGAVLFEILTGRTPFTGVNIFEVIGKVMRDEVQPPISIDRNIPIDLSLVCQKCLAREKEERYRSTQEIIEALDVFRQSETERKSQRLEEILSRYLSPGVLNRLEGRLDPIELRPGIKDLTVMFIDIAGFTPMMNEFPIIELATDFLSSYFEITVATVEKWGGDVNKFIGDALLVIFGDIDPNPDHPVRAIRCALELQKALGAFIRSESAGRFNCKGQRIGLNTGDVYLGNFGYKDRMDYTVLGDVVNQAARTEGFAPIGGVAVAEGLMKRIEDLKYEGLDSKLEFFKQEPHVSPKGRELNFWTVRQNDEL